MDKNHKKIRVWPPVILLFMVARTSEVEIKEEATCNVQFVQACAMCNLKCELQWAMCNACTHLRGGDKRAAASRGHLQCSVCARLYSVQQCTIWCSVCSVNYNVKYSVHCGRFSVQCAMLASTSEVEQPAEATCDVCTNKRSKQWGCCVQCKV